MSDSSPTADPTAIPVPSIHASDVSTRDTIEAIGAQYIESETLPGEDRVAHCRRLYRAVAAVTVDLFDRIPITVTWTTEDPYDSYDDMRESVFATGELKIFAGGTHPTHMSPEENLQFRAVHDYWGHLYHDVDFSFAGEFRKWNQLRHRYPAETHPVLFGEVVGQQAAACYCADGFDDDAFRQRPVIAPADWIDSAHRAVENKVGAIAVTEPRAWDEKVTEDEDETNDDPEPLLNRRERHDRLDIDM